MRPWLALGLLLALAACSDDSDDKKAQACAPGQQIECACPGGTTKGAQVCNSEGSGYGACQPCGIGGAGGAAGAGGAGAGGSGGDASSPGPGCVYDPLKKEGCAINPTPNKPTPYVGCTSLPDTCVESKYPPFKEIGVVCCPKRD